jgi:hypothetical protein
VVRGLHRFLIVEEVGSGDPTSTLSKMRRSRKLPFVLSIAETEALLETAHALAADPSVGLYRQAGYARRAALFGLASKNWTASDEAGGSLCPTRALRKSFGMRLCGSP